MMWLLPNEPYELTLEDGREVIVDLSNDNDWVHICFDDGTYIDTESVHRKITDVYDIDQESHIVNSELFERAKRYSRVHSRKDCR